MKPSLLQLATFLLLIVGTALLSSCVSVQPVPLNTSSIILDQPYSRNIEMGVLGIWHISHTITFPAGTYRPDFQTDKGIYYLAPTPIISSVYSASGLYGGLFIPKSPDGKQGVWAVADLSDDAFRARHDDFNEPIPYHQETALSHGKNSRVEP
jgi:hypothetical protein